MAYKETNRHLFLTVVEAGKSKIEVSADSVPGESYFSGLQMDAFLEIDPHVAERSSSDVTSSSYKSTNPVTETLPS